MRWPVFWLLTLLCASSSAETFRARVIHVADGDSIVVILADRRVDVRLLDIDAPERRQPYGDVSRDSLTRLCAGEVATIDARGRDRYGRTLARVSCRGMDASTAQVKAGLAHVFERYAAVDSPLYALQDEARNARRGVWSQAGTLPPWEWRERQRN